MKFDKQKARKICEHCCAPFSEVTDEHVSIAMEHFYLALDRIDELEALTPEHPDFAIDMKKIERGKLPRAEAPWLSVALL